MKELLTMLPCQRQEHIDVIEAILGRVPSVKALVIGDIMMDSYVGGPTHRRSPEANAPVVLNPTRAWLLGGAGNVAANLRSLGAKTSIIGAFGTGVASTQAAKLLNDAGIHGEFAWANRRDMIVKTRIIVDGVHVARIDDERNTELDDDDRKHLEMSVRQMVGNADLMILSDYAKGVVSPELRQMALTLARRHEITVGMDTKPAVLRAMTRQDFNGIDWIKPNGQELAQWLGRDPSYRMNPLSQDLQEALPKCGCRILATLGTAGMALCESDCSSLLHTGALNPKPVEVSGAGDTVMAAYGLANVLGYSGEECLLFASVCAAVAVGKPWTSTVTPEEIRKAIYA